MLVGTDRNVGLQPLEIDPGLSDDELDQHVAVTFADWVNGGPEPETSGRQNLHVLAILNALIDSGASGRPVKVEV